MTITPISFSFIFTLRLILFIQRIILTPYFLFCALFKFFFCYSDKMRVPVYVMCAALIAAVKTDKSSLFNVNEPPENDVGHRMVDPIGLELLLPRLLYAKARQQQLQQEQQQRLDASATNNINNNNNNNRQWIPFNPYPYVNIESNDVDEQVIEANNSINFASCSYFCKPIKCFELNCKRLRKPFKV